MFLTIQFKYQFEKGNSPENDTQTWGFLAQNGGFWAQNDGALLASSWGH